ncbi:MAG: hypothetical protein ACI8ZM_001391 [Crocinitomix sp.]|jgi:hypothetical protein
MRQYYQKYEILVEPNHVSAILYRSRKICLEIGKFNLICINSKSFGLILEAELLNDKKNYIYAYSIHDYCYSYGTSQIKEDSRFT